MSQEAHEVRSFKGYRLNVKGVVLGKLNPALVVPFIALFAFHWLPLQCVLVILMGALIALDLIGVSASEAFRHINVFMKRSKVIPCSIDPKLRLKNLRKFGLD